MKIKLHKWLCKDEVNRVVRKKKNHQHTESVRRKVVASTEMAKLGLSLTDNLSVVGFVFNHLAVSQLTYLGLESINRVCKEHVGVDICLFSQHLIPSCLQLLCPVFSVSELTRWHDYPLITTSIGTTIAALASNANIVYHFAFDPEFIDKSHYKSSNLQKAFCHPRVKVIVRHESHKKLIETEFGIQVCDVIVSDLDAEALIKFVLTERKNGYGNKLTNKT